MSTTLPLFWNLSSASKKERIDASVKLVGALEQFQSQFVPKQTAATTGAGGKVNGEGGDSDASEDEDDAQSDGVGKKGDERLDLLNAQDVSYSIRRLIRGLASPRESSRLGFAVALTELLSRIETVTCAQIVNLIMSSSKTQGSMSGQEERDVLFARLFGFMAVIRSGLLLRETPLPASASSNTASSSLEAFEEVLKESLALGEKKSWLREGAWFTIGLAVDALEDSNVEWKKDATDTVFQHLIVDNSTWSPEKIALVIKLQRIHPERDWQKLVAPTFKNANLLSSSNLLTVSKILKEAVVEDEAQKDVIKAPSSAWKAQLHFAWDVILDQLLPGPNDPKGQTKGSLQEFFRVVVDESLFSATSSPQRKYWGFQVFQRALKRVDQDSMPMLFTKNFMRSWINHLSNKDRYLHKIAQQTATEVQAFVKDNPQLGFALILQLTGVNGSQQFDKLTKTKTVESILASMDAEGIQSFVQYLFEQFNKPDAKSGQTEIDSRRNWIIDQLNGLVRNGNVPKSDEWVKAILDFFVVHGLFMIKKKKSKSSTLALREIPSPVVSDSVRENCRNRLLTCLGELTGQTNVIKAGDDKTVKASATASDGELWLAKVATTIQTLEEDLKHVELLNELEDEDKVLVKKSGELLTQIRNVREQYSEVAKGTELLLLALVVQLYCEGDSTTLETIIEAIGRFSFLEKKSKKKKTKSAEPEPEGTYTPIDVLADVIIGFLEGDTPYMRSIVNQAFGYISGAVEESTLDLLIAQLERRSPAELAADDDEDEDVEMDGENGSGKEEDSGSSSDESFGEIDMGDEEEEDDIDLELRKRIEDALRAAGVGAATGEEDEEDDEEDEDEDDEEEDLMDDDQMMAIDEHLAKIFSERTKEKKGKDGNAQRKATHFKNRVLDLLDVYIRKHPTHRLIPRLILPLLEVVVNSSADETQLRDKTKGLLRARICKAKEYPTDANAEEATEILNALHTQGRKSHHGSDIIELLGYSSIYVSKLLFQLGKDDLVIDAYRESLQDFMTRKNSALNPHFFKIFFQRYPAQGWKLRQDLLELSSKGINGYRQVQAVQLLEILVNQLSNIDESDKSTISEFITELQRLLLDLATQSCTETLKLNATQAKELMKVVVAAVRQSKRIIPDTLSDVWQSESWSTLKASFKASPRFKSSTAIHKMCEQVAQLSQKPDAGGKEKPTKKKRKATDEPDVKAKTKTKKAKVKS
ncbi:DNA-directed DNA polymerase, partial [Coprinopsis marcescibilis]